MPVGAGVGAACTWPRLIRKIADAATILLAMLLLTSFWNVSMTTPPVAKKVTCAFGRRPNSDNHENTNYHHRPHQSPRYHPEAQGTGNRDIPLAVVIDQHQISRVVAKAQLRYLREVPAELLLELAVLIFERIAAVVIDGLVYREAVVPADAEYPVTGWDDQPLGSIDIEQGYLVLALHYEDIT